MSCLQHEEADTRIFAHTRHCVETLGYTRVIIAATESDIIMTGIYFSTHIPCFSELWLHKANVYLPCHTITSNLEKKYNQYIASILLSIYILSGCDLRHSVISVSQRKEECPQSRITKCTFSHSTCRVWKKRL